MCKVIGILATGLIAGGAFGVTVGVAVSPATVVNEDDSAWDCVSMGNRVCGPANPQGHTAACYDDGGVIVALWPCRVVVNQDGSSDVFEGR